MALAAPVAGALALVRDSAPAFVNSAWAQDEQAAEASGGDSASGTESSEPEPTTQPAVLIKKPAKGKRIREKEAEGSEAPGRFEADTVIKSKYHLDGQPLEVDPD